MTQPYQLTAADGIQQIAQGKLSAAEWAASCSGQIKKLDSAVKSWIYFRENEFLERAKNFDDFFLKNRETEIPSPLGGLPVGVKDIFNTIDMPACMGSPIWKDFQPGNDARVVFTLKEAGAVMAGKTVTAEFAVHAPGETRNPRNLDHSPGTSSSGSAAAVACGMVPVALGTQTAGSIIRPASYCGVYGFKPSFGLIPRTGVLKTTDSLDTIGFFARQSRDLRMVLDHARVQGLDYPTVHAFLENPNLQKPLGKKWKVGIVGPGLRVWDNTADYARTALAQFKDALGRCDVELEEVRLSENFNKAHEIHETIYDKALAYYFRDEFKSHTLVSKIIYEIITRGNQVTLEQYTAAQERQRLLAHELEAVLEKYDVLLTLSTAGHAPKFGEDDIPDSCLIWTLCGVPTLNIPAFKSPQGLPFGLQLLSARYRDYRLLQFAGFLEQALPNYCRTEIVESFQDSLVQPKR